MWGAVDWRGYKLFGRPIDHPMTGPISRIVAGHEFVSGKHHLPPAIEVADDRRAIAASMILAGRFPEGSSIGPGKGDQIRVAVVIAIQDHLVFKENGRSAEAVHAFEFAWANQPLPLAIKIVGGSQHFLTVEEGDIDQFPIRGRGAGGVHVQGVLLFQGCGQDGPGPEDASSLAILAKQLPFFCVGQGCDREDSVVKDNWGGVPRAGEGCLPNQVAGTAPMDWNCRLEAGAIAARSAPAWPIFGSRVDGGRGDQGDQQQSDRV